MMNNLFRRLSTKVSNIAGSAPVFFLAVMVVVVWAITGPMFDFSDTWQLVINTGTTIVTFLMVFLIQNTQNRDSKAMQLKLDELIRSTKARNSFMVIEDLSDEELAALDQEFRVLHEKQMTTKTLHKLHEKIEQEHKRRQVIREQANRVINKLNPLSKDSSKK